MKIILIVVFLLFFGLMVMFAIKAKLSRESGGPKGLQNGRLFACENKPNCVSTASSGDAHRVEMIAIPSRLADLNSALLYAQEAVIRAGGKIKSVNKNYFHAEFTSQLFGFVDDVEIVIEFEQRQIQFRSASRQGYSDFGANKKRYSKIKSEIGS